MEGIDSLYWFPRVLCDRLGFWSPFRVCGKLYILGCTSEYAFGEDSPADHGLFSHATALAGLL